MIDTNARTTAKQRVHELSYGKDRDDKDELLTVLDNIAAEWQRDKDALSAYKTLPDDLDELQRLTEAWEPHVTRRNIAAMKICIMLSRAREQLTAIKSFCAEDREDMGVEGFQKEILELLKEQA